MSQSNARPRRPYAPTVFYICIRSNGHLVRQRIFPPADTLRVYEERARKWMSAMWGLPLSGDSVACKAAKCAANAVERHWPFISIMNLHFTGQGYSSSAVRDFVFGDIHLQLQDMEKILALCSMMRYPLDESEGIRQLWEIVVSNELFNYMLMFALMIWRNWAATRSRLRSLLLCEAVSAVGVWTEMFGGPSKNGSKDGGTIKSLQEFYAVKVK